jgi:uncharacterized protein
LCRIQDTITIEHVIANWEPPLAEYVYPSMAMDPTGHDIYHCLRVKMLALRIAAGEDLDRNVLVATAYLHDIGRQHEWQGEGDHVDIGAAAAREILPQIPFPAEKTAIVARCIAHHEEYDWAQSGQALDGEGERELRGFQDADRLDAIGAIGLARMFSFGGAYRRPIWIPGVEPGHWEHGVLGSSSYAHLYEKLLKLRDTMNTATGRAIATGRHRFMEAFARQFEAEWTGEL